MKEDMMKKISLLIIDPQIDFCDPKGALSVPGAEKDMDRLANFIIREGYKINQIHVTLDSHHFFDVAHPSFWINENGVHPDVYTVISYTDIQNGVWKPDGDAQLVKDMLKYVKTLEVGNKYPLRIWPPHCLIGSRGHAVVPILFDALIEWEACGNTVDYIRKGENIKTEHFSAIRAEVPDPKDKNTQINYKLTNSLLTSDMIIIGGEAGTHCVKSTVEDIVDLIGLFDVSRIVLLTDAMSPVRGYEQEQEDFISKMISLGLQTSTTKELKL